MEQVLPTPRLVKAALVTERAKWGPTIDSDVMVAILNTVAGQWPGLGLHRYEGTHGTQAGTGIHVSRQILRFLPVGDLFGWWADVLASTGTGAAIPIEPNWQRSNDDAASFVPPVGVVIIPPQPPIQPPATPTLTEADVRRIVSEMLLNGVAIKSNRNRYMRDDWSTDNAKFDRVEAGSGETFTVEIVK